VQYDHPTYRTAAVFHSRQALWSSAQPNRLFSLFQTLPQILITVVIRVVPHVLLDQALSPYLLFECLVKLVEFIPQLLHNLDHILTLFVELISEFEFQFLHDVELLLILILTFVATNERHQQGQFVVINSIFSLNLCFEVAKLLPDISHHFFSLVAANTSY